MDRLESLIGELRVLAKMHAAGVGGGSDVELFESKIYKYLADLREVIRAEKARKHVGEGDFWILVEEYIDQLKPIDR